MQKTELISRGIIVKDGKILLCKSLTKDFYFLPGGHIEEGEKPEFTLERELMEEMGRKPVKVKMIEEVKNTFTRNNGDIIESFYIFLITLDDYRNIESKENHLGFEWVNYRDLEKVNFKPQKAVPDILKSIEENINFWSI